jgi:phenylacetate-coenzyme A ligase PaaK-like adenylate-forming protein
MHLPSPAFESLDAVQSLPFTTVNDLAQNPNRFLCTSQDRIQRIVTLPTSGTVRAKRIFFTAEDLERTAEYFAHGVMGVAKPGESRAPGFALFLSIQHPAHTNCSMQSKTRRPPA